MYTYMYIFAAVAGARHVLPHLAACPVWRVSWEVLHRCLTPGAQVAAPLVASAHAAINSGRAARRWISRGPGQGGYYEAGSAGPDDDASSGELEAPEQEQVIIRCRDKQR